MIEHEDDVDPYMVTACDGDIHEKMAGYLSKRLITLGEAVEVYEKMASERG